MIWPSRAWTFATAERLLSALPTGAHGVDSTDRLRAWVGEHTEEYVVVLGPHLGIEDALAACEALRTGRPTISVVEKANSNVRIIRRMCATATREGRPLSRRRSAACG